MYLKLIKKWLSRSPTTKFIEVPKITELNFYFKFTFSSQK